MYVLSFYVIRFEILNLRFKFYNLAPDPTYANSRPHLGKFQTPLRQIPDPKE